VQLILNQQHSILNLQNVFLTVRKINTLKLLHLLVKVVQKIVHVVTTSQGNAPSVYRVQFTILMSQKINAIKDVSLTNLELMLGNVEIVRLIVCSVQIQLEYAQSA
jgi:hypothetical protein